MKYNHIICHYDEIALKGKNRKYFEKKLVENIKLALKRANINFDSISNLSGRILINLSNDTYKEEEVKFALSKVFGVVNFSFTLESSRGLEEIKSLSLEMLKDKHFKTFRISATRSDKSFEFTSQEVNEKVGEYILDNLEKKVDLTNPDETVYIEITKDSAYIYLEKHFGYGGLPVGTGGRALSLMSGGIDSPVASFMIAKRGVKVDYIHFH
ncbi:MAG: THUMP domain-containing protein, partial [Candidatus Paceibacterota bacterium]